MSHAIFLETERMILRRATPRDAHLLYELDSDPEVMRFISRGVPTPLERIEREPKSFGWKMRAKIGERKRWYDLPEEVEGGP